MQFLTLEARVVVGANGDHTSQITPPLILSSPEPGSLDPPSSRPKLASSGSVPGIARAMELLEQSTEALERSRRSHYVVQPNAIQRPVPNNVRPVNPTRSRSRTAVAIPD